MYHTHTANREQQQRTNIYPYIPHDAERGVRSAGDGAASHRGINFELK